MIKNHQFTRRHFLKAATAVTASAPFLLPSGVWAAEGGAQPNSKINMGFIGVGTQGRGLLNGFLHSEEVQVLAVCDVDTTRRNHSKKTVDDFYANKGNKDDKGCATHTDFRELLDRKDIDAVCIATPDHWHAIPCVLACEKGKDIYCEKPLSLTIPEARAMANAVRKYNRVFQTGSMQRSDSAFLKGCELVRNGVIGETCPRKKWNRAWIGASGSAPPRNGLTTRCSVRAACISISRTGATTASTPVAA